MNGYCPNKQVPRGPLPSWIPDTNLYKRTIAIDAVKQQSQY